MLNILKTASVLASASGYTSSNPTYTSSLKADISEKKDVPAKKNLDEKLEYALVTEKDNEYGAVFTGKSYNFFPMAYDTTIADTVMHDTYTTEAKGEESEIKLKATQSLHGIRYQDALCLNQ